MTLDKDFIKNIVNKNYVKANEAVEKTMANLAIAAIADYKNTVAENFLEAKKCDDIKEAEDECECDDEDGCECDDVEEAAKDRYSVRVGNGNKFHTFTVAADTPQEAKTKAVEMFKKRFDSRGLGVGTPKADNIKKVEKE